MPESTLNHGTTFAFCWNEEKLAQKRGLRSAEDRVTGLLKLSRRNEKLMSTEAGVRTYTEAKLTQGSLTCPGFIWTGP